MNTLESEVNWRTAPNALPSLADHDRARSSGYLHLTLHLVSGSSHEFVQTDAVATQMILRSVRPARLFAQEHIVIASPGSVTVVPCAEIERIMLRFAYRPRCATPPGVRMAQEIADTTYMEAQCFPWLAVRQGVTVAAEMRSGAVYHVRLLHDPEHDADMAQRITPSDTSRFLAHLFAGPPIFGETLDGDGLFLLNPANAVRFTLAPALPDVAAGAWQMQPDVP